MSSTLSDILLEANGRAFKLLLIEPPKQQLAADPQLMMTFSADRHHAIDQPEVAHFIEAGHRAISFDLPHHGDRVLPNHAHGITGMRDAFLAGQDPFTMFIEDSIACIDACLKRNITNHGIYLLGLSRGGYCALRLAACDHRVLAVSAIAPVTDWSILREFGSVANDIRVQNIALYHWARQLIDCHGFILIGNADHRVATHSCLRFAAWVIDQQQQQGIKQSHWQLEVTQDGPNHSVSPQSKIRAVDFLLAQIKRGQTDKAERHPNIASGK